MTLPNTIIMNTNNVRANSRPKLSLRYGAVHAQTFTGEGPRTALLPTTELRRLVAKMVD